MKTCLVHLPVLKQIMGMKFQGQSKTGVSAADALAWLAHMLRAMVNSGRIIRIIRTVMPSYLRKASHHYKRFLHISKTLPTYKHYKVCLQPSEKVTEIEQFLVVLIDDCYPGKVGKET